MKPLSFDLDQVLVERAPQTLGDAPLAAFVDQVVDEIRVGQTS